MRNRIDLRTLFQSLEDPAPSDGFVERVMRQVAATHRPIEMAAPTAHILSFPVPRWARASAGLAAAAALLSLVAGALLTPSTWLGVTDAFKASLFSAVWILTWFAGAFVESLTFVSGAVQVGEALDLVLSTPLVTSVAAAAMFLCLAAVVLLHRLSRAPGGRSRARGARAGAMLLVGGLCCTGLAFGQPQESQEAQESEEVRGDESEDPAQDEVGAALEEARERLNEALEDAGERAQGAIEETIERLEEFERGNILDGGPGEIVVDLDNKVAFGNTVRVGRDEVASDVVSIGGGVKVDGEVRGDAVSIGGEAKINGRVTGEVVAIGGDVELGPEAEVLGDIVAVGGRVRREDGSSVLGEVSEVDWGDFDWNWDGGWFNGWQGDWFPRLGERPPFFRLGKVFELVRSIIFTGLLIALSGLVLLVAPGVVDRVGSAAASNLLTMFVVGLGVEIFFIPALAIVCLLLSVTVIGIPFAILLIPVAVVSLALAFVLGYAGSAAAAGNWCRGRFEGVSHVAAGSFGALALGVLAIQALALIADLLGFLGLPWFFRAMFWFPGILICYVAWTVGLGAVCMTRFGASSYGMATAPALPPTPAPAAASGDAQADTAGDDSGDGPSTSTGTGGAEPTTEPPRD